MWQKLSVERSQLKKFSSTSIKHVTASFSIPYWMHLRNSSWIERRDLHRSFENIRSVSFEALELSRNLSIVLANWMTRMMLTLMWIRILYTVLFSLQAEKHTVNFVLAYPSSTVLFHCTFVAKLKGYVLELHKGIIVLVRSCTNSTKHIDCSHSGRTGGLSHSI
jgi:hypothetical protein